MRAPLWIDVLAVISVHLLDIKAGVLGLALHATLVCNVRVLCCHRGIGVREGCVLADLVFENDSKLIRNI